jgi:hypothetical protein
MCTVKRGCNKTFEFRKSEARLSKEMEFHNVVDILFNRQQVIFAFFAKEARREVRSNPMNDITPIQLLISGFIPNDIDVLHF